MLPLLGAGEDGAGALATCDSGACGDRGGALGVRSTGRDEAREEELGALDITGVRLAGAAGRGSGLEASGVMTPSDSVTGRPDALAVSLAPGASLAGATIAFDAPATEAWFCRTAR